MIRKLLSKKSGPEDFKRAFHLFDKDERYYYVQKCGELTDTYSSGRISSEELKAVLTEFGEMRLSLEEAEDMISMVDSDKDNMMDYMEFVTLFTQSTDIYQEEEKSNQIMNPE